MSRIIIRERIIVVKAIGQVSVRVSGGNKREDSYEIGTCGNRSQQEEIAERRDWLTCVSALVDLQILGSGEDFGTLGEGARERLFARVHADVVDQLVLGLKRLSRSRTVQPEARVVVDFGSAHMLHCDVRHDLRHRGEHLVAGDPVRLRFQVLLIDPQAADVLLQHPVHVTQWPG